MITNQGCTEGGGEIGPSQGRKNDHKKKRSLRVGLFPQQVVAKNPRISLLSPIKNYATWLFCLRIAAKQLPFALLAKDKKFAVSMQEEIQED
ncbi:hypothetical protein AVEN_37433-1 [Araneus ventricosus]|uniref:Uncharacterized protein n=1 Tax=Araneus ventricosus TaxID=182803 RepID=A0A4Y2FD66_ARAVE|nr:hypothetical protein AVEN_37433-1 [Araneus ventricosus]